MPARTRYIVTFKPKDKRSAKVKDKTEVFTAAVDQDFEFLTAADTTSGRATPSRFEADEVAYDVNEYEAPIVIASLTPEQAKALESDRNVARVEEDGEMYALGIAVEGQPAVTEETIPAGVAQIKAPRGWECSRGKAIKVAVLDTGIDDTHPDLAANFRGGISFVAGESNSRDYNGHGTHVAGTIAAAANGAGVVGVAPSAYLYAVKVLDRSGRGAWSNLIAGIDWCVNRKGMKVLNMSLGGPDGPQALEQMCDLAWSRGALLVAAAGNNGGAVGVPARFGTVIAVSAIDAGNQLASFSSRGPEVELCAPGVEVLSTLPEGGHGKLSGTSMASPHVAGAAALAWGGHRYSDNLTIRRLLAWRADNLGIPGRDDDFGYGRVDAEQAACELTEPPAIPGIP